MSIVVFNAGSSSLKLGLYDGDARELAIGEVDWKADPAHAELTIQRGDGAPERSQHEVRDFHVAVAVALQALVGPPDAPARRQIAAVGQRVVHGGATLTASARIDERVRAEIERLTELAPLHNPPALEAIDAVARALPGVPQLAVFDTAFYAALPPLHHRYALPHQWHAEWGIRRFGFHGISHAYCAERVVELAGDGLRVISCHLGSGCSATAMRGRQAVATTMGFTPMDGLMMGTRAGAVDPGILLYVQQRRGLDAATVDRQLNHEAGLLGVSGVSSDYRQGERAAGDGDEHARLALDLFALRVRQEIGALAVTLGGVDVLLFTAGVGEHAATLRAAACAGLDCLGVRLDARKNGAARPDCEIGAADSRARVFVVHTREEWMIAREARRLLE